MGESPGHAYRPIGVIFICMGLKCRLYATNTMQSVVYVLKSPRLFWCLSEEKGCFKGNIGP